jgi:hypothetical protein
MYKGVNAGSAAAASGGLPASTASLRRRFDEGNQRLTFGALQGQLLAYQIRIVREGLAGTLARIDVA